MEGLLLFALVFLLQLWCAGWWKSSLRQLILRPGRSEITDWLFSFIHLAGWTPYLIFIFSFGTAWASVQFAQGITQLSAPWRIRLTGLFVIDGLVYYFIFSFFDYWNHRFWHLKAGWLLHRTHHSAEHLSPLVAHRNHPLQLALEPFIRIWPLAFLDISATVVVGAGLLDYAYQMIVHTDLPGLDWGWFGRWILVSPEGHRIHHSPLPEHADKNFAIVILWDRLFGTWHAGPLRNEAVGIAEPVHNRRAIWWELNTDSVAFLSALLGRSRS